MAEERLQKIIASAGIASRRKAEELITGGDVTVNGHVVTELGTKAELGKDHIKVFGKLIKPPTRMVYIALNKPVACVTTVTDPEGRKTVMEYVRGLKDRVYPVGRLDYHSEGLLLFTNDGEFANRITSAKFHVQKTYLVKANGNLDVEQLEKFRNGLPISGKRTAPAEIRLHKPGANPWYEVKLTEGRQNQIRLMFRHLGRLVERLRRVRIGFVELGKLKTGTWRPLTEQEVYKLRRQVGLKDEESGADQDEGFIREVRSPMPKAETPTVIKPEIAKTRQPKPRDDRFRRPKFNAPKTAKAPEPAAPYERESKFPGPKGRGDDARSSDSRPVRSSFSDSRGPKAPTKQRGAKPPFGKPQFGKAPVRKDPFGKEPFDKEPFSKATGPRSTFAKGPGAKAPFSKTTGSKAPFAKATGSKAPFGKAPFGKAPGGKASFNKSPGGRPPASRDFSSRPPASKNRAPGNRNKPRNQR